MDKYTEYYSAIDTIIDFLSMDLIGPVEDDEVLINQTPLDIYAMGILWPKRLNDVDYSADEEDETVEDLTAVGNESIYNANKYKPSAMAISVIVPLSENKITVSFDYAQYIHSEETDNDGKRTHYYTRNRKTEKLILSIPNGEARKTTTIETVDHRVVIQCHYRKRLKNGVLVTVSASNKKAAQQKTLAQNEEALFQCKLRLNCDKGFEPINSQINNNADIEASINDMLYKHILNYANGHGCAVECIDACNVESRFLPRQRVSLMMPAAVKNDGILYMEYWHNSDRTASIKDLHDFVGEYENWFNHLSTIRTADYKKAAEHNLGKIKKCIERLNKGIDVLAHNADAWRAFLLMNEAMLLQRVHTKNCKGSTVKWYPFQLAYVLQILPDIVDVDSDFRKVVDLLWFPTGGGKTEAYLGVCAFVIFYRRLTHISLKQDGVSIFMRYTLRLLTIQQFERAMALICACEHLRRKNKLSGGEINIGLWIGISMTPNHLKGENGAADKLNKILEQGEESIRDGNPMQVTHCPWCGVPLSVHDYSVGEFMNIRCPNNACEFHEHLPVYLIDDDIYNKRPTLVLSTVDKFARLVWEEKAKNLFCPDDLPTPDLILQDELHLISGPLGSLTGAYETAVDLLCSSKGISPKIIASTATVCRAKEQIKALYNREMFQFPPSGLDVRDSFFAKEASDEERPARTYIGLTEPGGSLSDLIIRVYSILIFMRELMKKQGVSSQVIDQYFTIVGYFNAIKDLGASANILNDRIASYVKMIINNKFRKYAESAGLSTDDISLYLDAEELTSRKNAKEIKSTLDRLSLKYTDDRCYSHVLASNMLSVGIDIDRLGVMTMYNQPKTNSEYIQATSRVGRSNPGLVIDMYNNQRARDKSHYEQFEYYHRTFYKYVEATSVTPFSSRAIEKTLQGVFIGLVRHMIHGMNRNDAAAKFNDRINEVSKIKLMILDRINAVNPRAYEDAKEWLDGVSYEWDCLADEYGAAFTYDTKDKPCLLNSVENQNGITDRFPLILNSLRNVEASSNIYIKQHHYE